MAADKGAFAIRDDLSDIPMKEWHYVGEVSRARTCVHQHYRMLPLNFSFSILQMIIEQFSELTEPWHDARI